MKLHNWEYVDLVAPNRSNININNNLVTFSTADDFIEVRGHYNRN